MGLLPMEAIGKEEITACRSLLPLGTMGTYSGLLSKRSVWRINLWALNSSQLGNIIITRNDDT